MPYINAAGCIVYNNLNYTMENLRYMSEKKIEVYFICIKAYCIVASSVAMGVIVSPTDYALS